MEQSCRARTADKRGAGALTRQMHGAAPGWGVYPRPSNPQRRATQWRTLSSEQVSGPERGAGRQPGGSPLQSPAACTGPVWSLSTPERGGVPSDPISVPLIVFPPSPPPPLTPPTSINSCIPDPPSLALLPLS